MNKRQLIYFIEVYQRQNINNASEHLFISRQGVSKVIRSIEKELGQKLFTRTSEGVFPTDFAIALYPHALKLLDEYNYIKGMNTLSTQKKSVLTIYCIDYFFSYLSADFFIDFGKMYPNITLNVLDTTDNFALEGLMTQKCQFAIVNGPLDFTQFKGTELFYSRYCARLHKNHPLAQNKSLNLSDLNGEIIAGKGRNYRCFRNNIDKYLLEPGYDVNILTETSDELILTELVKKNQAIVLGFDYSASIFKHENIVTIPLNTTETGQNIYLVEKDNAHVTKTGQLFKKFLVEWIQAHNKQQIPWN